MCSRIWLIVRPAAPPGPAASTVIFTASSRTQSIIIYSVKNCIDIVVVIIKIVIIIIGIICERVHIFDSNIRAFSMKNKCRIIKKNLCVLNVCGQ